MILFRKTWEDFRLFIKSRRLWQVCIVYSKMIEQTSPQRIRSTMKQIHQSLDLRRFKYWKNSRSHKINQKRKIQQTYCALIYTYTHILKYANTYIKVYMHSIQIYIRQPSMLRPVNVNLHCLKNKSNYSKRLSTKYNA